jgi:hypothetical protein
MGRKWSSLNQLGALHYLTGNLLDRMPVFTQPSCCMKEPGWYTHEKRKRKSGGRPPSLPEKLLKLNCQITLK